MFSSLDAERDPYEARVLFSSEAEAVKDAVALGPRARFVGSTALEAAAATSADLDIADVGEARAATALRRKVVELMKRHDALFMEVKAGQDSAEVAPMGSLVITDGVAALHGWDPDAVREWAAKRFPGEKVPEMPSAAEWLRLWAVFRERWVLRWNVREVMAGRKELASGKPIKLADALKEPRIAKLDAVFVMFSQLVEVEAVYRFEPDIAAAIQRSQARAFFAGNWAKLYRRLFAAAAVAGDESRGRELLVAYRSPYMALYRIAARIGAILEALGVEREREDIAELCAVAADLLVDRLAELAWALPALDVSKVAALRIAGKRPSEAVTALKEVHAYLVSLFEPFFKERLAAVGWSPANLSARFDTRAAEGAKPEPHAVKLGGPEWAPGTSEPDKEEDPRDQLVRFELPSSEHDPAAGFVIRPPFRAVALGSSGAGKTYTVLSMLMSDPPAFFRGYFQTIYIICPTLDSAIASPYRAIDFDDKAVRVFNDLDDKVVGEIFGSLPKTKEGGYAPSLILMDDVGQLPRSSLLVRKVWQRSRHGNVSLCLIVQYPSMIPPAIRMSLSHIFLHAMPRAMVEQVCREFLTPSMVSPIQKAIGAKKHTFVLLDVGRGMCHEAFSTVVVADPEPATAPPAEAGPAIRVLKTRVVVERSPLGARRVFPYKPGSEEAKAAAMAAAELYSRSTVPAEKTTSR